MLKAQKQTETNIASLTEDIATVRGLLARPEHARSAAQQPAPESGLATQLAQAEGRIAGHVDNLAELVRPVAATPKALKDLEAAVRPLAEAVRAETRATKANTSYLNRMTLDLKDMVRDADLGMRHRFAEEAKGVREALQEATAVVVKRRRRSIRFWLGLAGAVLFGLLVCVGLGVWLQSEYGPLPAYDPTEDGAATSGKNSVLLSRTASSKCARPEARWIAGSRHLDLDMRRHARPRRRIRVETGLRGIGLYRSAAQFPDPSWSGM